MIRVLPLCCAPTATRSQFFGCRKTLQTQTIFIGRSGTLVHQSRNSRLHSIITAHAGHGHGDGSDIPRDNACSGHHGHSHDHADAAHSCGHSHTDSLWFAHGHHHAHKTSLLQHLLSEGLRRTGLSSLAGWLDGSVFSSIAKIVLFIAAAATAWAAGNIGDVVTETTLRTVSTAATAGVFFFAGIPAAINLALDLASLHIDTHVLMNLAVVGTLITGFPLEGALLLVLFQTSHSVEHLLTAQAQGNLQALYDVVPEHADIVKLGPDGAPNMATVKHLLAEEVSVGEIMLVKPGGQIPLDGTIVYGKSLVSAEHITGEALPSLRKPGDDVPAGALSHDGILALRATRVADDSTPARIARLARDAQAQRPQLRAWLDNFGEWYSKAVIAGTIVAFAVMVGSGVPIVGSLGAERGALYRAMGLLTVASPCALVMVPLAYVSAIAAVASRGVLLKGGRVLDALDRCRAVGVDKTGTLTTGRLAVKSLMRISSESHVLNESAVLAAAAALSIRSSHPVSDAVVEESLAKGVEHSTVKVSDFNLVAGGGVKAVVSLKTLPDKNRNTNGSSPFSSSLPSSSSHVQYQAYFGSLDYVGPELSLAEMDEVRTKTAEQGSSTVSVLVLKPIEPTAGEAGSAVWVFTLEDSLRSVSSAAIAALQQGSWAGFGPSSGRACTVTMLTGDNKASAARIAGQLGITNVMSGLSPEDKLREVAALRVAAGTARGGVIMVGDGLNDAAALAAADVGIAIASTSIAAATLAADAVVINESSGMAAVPFLLRVARATRYVIAQNLALAAGSILVLAGPTVLGIMPLWLAVMLHEGSTLLVALNSLRLLRFSSVAFGKKGKGKIVAGTGKGGEFKDNSKSHSEDEAVELEMNELVSAPSAA